jgi:hypothetical protein
MRGEMELWDEVFQRELALGEPEVFRIGFHPLKQIDRPAACYIVRNLDPFDLLVFQGR